MRNNKILEEQDTGAYLRSITKTMLRDMPRGQHDFKLSYQSDCGIYHAGVLDSTYVVVLELDFSYEMMPHPGQDQNMAANGQIPNQPPPGIQIEKYGFMLNDIIFDT